MKILTNHLGYETKGHKRAVLQCETKAQDTKFMIIDSLTENTVFEGKCIEVGLVARWDKGYFYTLHFDEFTAQGEYYIKLIGYNDKIKSFPFQIRDNMLGQQTLSDIGFYFKAQRDTGEIAAASSKCRFRGPREGINDVHGGWYDASADFATYISHLTFSTYFNPQQVPLASWAFFKSFDLLEESGNEMYSMLERRYFEEAMFGADWIYRMRAPSGSFFCSVNREDAFGEVESHRYLAYGYDNDDEEFMEMKDRDAIEITDKMYESSFRSGGGMAIATLACAGRNYYNSSDHSQHEYIKLAKNSYRYMAENNRKHTNNGQENLLDHYCELMAVTELYNTTKEVSYKFKAREVASALIAYQVEQPNDSAYWSVDGTKRPFFHASDAGLPVVALLNYYDMETSTKHKEIALNACIKSLKHELYVTGEVNNPFNYARQLVVTNKGDLRTQFFFRHDAETASWWQGDNARICSLSTAARYLSYYVSDNVFKSALCRYADSQIDWVLGLNPYDSSMMQGQGRNHIRYFFNGKYDFMACPGGIANGITGGLHDEDGIDFFKEPCGDLQDNWRWSEQWIPHAAWYMLAVSMKKL